MGEFRFPWSPYVYRIACVIEPELTRPLWARDPWMEDVFPHLDAVISGIGLPAFMRTYQTRAGRDRPLPFGRLKWSRANNERWTTEYLEGPDPAHFWEMETWARDWVYHEEHGGNPDVFFRVVHLTYPERQAFMLAIRKAVLPKVAEAADAALDAVTALYRQPCRMVFDRIWAEREFFFRAIRINPLDGASPNRLTEWGRAHPDRAVAGFRT